MVDGCPWQSVHYLWKLSLGAYSHDVCPPGRKADDAKIILRNTTKTSHRRAANQGLATPRNNTSAAHCHWGDLARPERHQGEPRHCLPVRPSSVGAVQSKVAATVVSPRHLHPLHPLQLQRTAQAPSNPTTVALATLTNLTTPNFQDLSIPKPPIDRISSSLSFSYRKSSAVVRRQSPLASRPQQLPPSRPSPTRSAAPPQPPPVVDPRKSSSRGPQTVPSTGHLAAPTLRDPPRAFSIPLETIFSFAILLLSYLAAPIDIDTSVPYSTGGSPTQLMPTATTPPRPRLSTWR